MMIRIYRFILSKADRNELKAREDRRMELPTPSNRKPKAQLL
jgi:hypothetical protein